MFTYLRLGDKTLLIKPYTTETELRVLEALQFNEFTDDNDFEPMVDSILEKCLKDISIIPKLSKLEKILTMWCIRMLTLGDEITVSYECINCGKKTQSTINLSDTFSQPKKRSDLLKSRIISSDEIGNIDIQKCVDEDTDIDVFEKFNLIDYLFIYNKKTHFNCPICNSDKFTDLISFKQCLSYLSEESLKGLTTWIHVLVYSDNHTRADVLNMTPLERMIEAQYFEDQIKEENSDARQ